MQTGTVFHILLVQQANLTKTTAGKILAFRSVGARELVVLTFIIKS